MQQALGLIETVGLAAAYEAADTALKTANVNLLGYELSKGDGMVTVKISGKVGAVQAGIKAAQMAASLVNKVYSVKVIPRPSHMVERMVYTNETVLYSEEYIGNEADVIERIDENESEQIDVQTEDISETKEKESKAAPEMVEEQMVLQESCNICGDPACPRQKGDPKRRCLHYFKN